MNAENAIGRLSPGCEIFVLTYGQFSLIDAVAALVRKTGPADVVLSTWTAGNTDLSASANLLADGAFRSFRMIVDNSFLQRQPGYCRRMVDLFGEEVIRVWKGHAKFAAIRNDEWNIAARTSMNLNTNPRVENLEISDDPGLCDFLFQIADDLFAEQDPIDWHARLPELKTVRFMDAPKIQMGRLEIG